MKSQGFNAHTKYRILQQGLKEKNIAKTCQLFGISRTTYYKWQENYEKHGMAGLENKEPKKPKMPNKVSRSLETEILNYVIKFPKDGPKRIYYELRAQGFELGESGIYNVLKRNNLTKSSQRQAYSRKGRPRPSSRKNPEKDLIRELTSKESYPGYLVTQSIDYLGSFEGIGKIYQYCFFDTCSRWAEVKLFRRKHDIDIWTFFEKKVVYLLEVFNLNIINIVSVKTRDYLPYYFKGDRYSTSIEGYNVNHSFISPEEKDFFRDMMDFKQSLAQDLYSQLDEKGIESFTRLEKEVEDYTRNHNFSLTILDGPNKGFTPAELVLERARKRGTDLETLPLWLLALINAPKKGGIHEGQD